MNFPRAYARLWDAISPDTPPADRPEHLEAFLEGWFKVMDSEVAAETHPFHPANFGYTSFWCVEAGAAAVVAGIDEGDLRRNPYYPKDWVDYARAEP